MIPADAMPERLANIVTSITRVSSQHHIEAAGFALH
jgi:hypothetical protein